MWQVDTRCPHAHLVATLLLMALLLLVLQLLLLLLQSGHDGGQNRECAPRHLVGLGAQVGIGKAVCGDKTAREPCCWCWWLCWQLSC